MGGALIFPHIHIYIVLVNGKNPGGDIPGPLSV